MIVAAANAITYSTVSQTTSKTEASTVSAANQSSYSLGNEGSPYSVLFQSAFWIFVIIISILTISGNLLVLMSFYFERSIRQPSNYFIFSLAVSDLIIGIEGFPLFTVYVLQGERWLLGTFFCNVWLCIDYTLCLVSIFTVLLITTDRYCSVCHTATYRKWQTVSKVYAMIAISWLLPLVLFIIMIFGWEYFTGTGMEEPEKCYVPFLTNPYVNMSLYIMYYWTVLVGYYTFPL